MQFIPLFQLDSICQRGVLRGGVFVYGNFETLRNRSHHICKFKFGKNIPIMKTQNDIYSPFLRFRGNPETNANRMHLIAKIKFGKNIPIMKSHNAIYAATLRILRPLVRLLLRHGIAFGTFSDLAKGVYVEVALEEFGIPGRKQTDSRVSILTGLSRKEVHRVTRLERPDDAETGGRYHRAARVIGGWVRDERFHDGSGNPAPLPFEGEGTTFSGLVKEYSGDVPHRAILDELLRVGVAERTADGQVRLLARAYIPVSGDEEKLEILGADTASLIETIDHNLQAEPGKAFFQRKTMYDNLPDEAVEELRNDLAVRAEKFLEQADRRMAERDRDANPKSAGTGRRRAGIGIFWFEDEGKRGR